FRPRYAGLSCVVSECTIGAMPRSKLAHTLILSATVLSCGAPCSGKPGKVTDLEAQVEAVLPPHCGVCILAVDGGDVVLEYARGMADAETGRICTPETNFRLASISKQFTATAVLLLVDRGIVALDDKITKFFPGF